MLRVGLTGGIATGKSLAAGFFEQKGASIIDADLIARQTVNPGQEGLRRVVDSFGPGVLTPAGDLDRAALGRLVFKDAQRLQQLNRILHPLILAQVEDHLSRIEKEDPHAIVVADVPLLVECGLQTRFDCVVVVFAGRELQLQRMIQRDGLDPQEADARLNAQMDIVEKRKFADYVIENTGTIDQLSDQVDRVFNSMKKKLCEG